LSVIFDLHETLKRSWPHDLVENARAAARLAEGRMARLTELAERVRLSDEAARRLAAAVADRLAKAARDGSSPSLSFALGRRCAPVASTAGAPGTTLLPLFPWAVAPRRPGERPQGAGEAFGAAVLIPRRGRGQESIALFGGAESLFRNAGAAPVRAAAKAAHDVGAPPALRTAAWSWTATCDDPFGPAFAGAREAARVQARRAAEEEARMGRVSAAAIPAILEAVAAALRASSPDVAAAARDSGLRDPLAEPDPDNPGTAVVGVCGPGGARLELLRVSLTGAHPGGEWNALRWSASSLLASAAETAAGGDPDLRAALERADDEGAAGAWEDVEGRFERADSLRPAVACMVAVGLARVFRSVGRGAGADAG